MKRKVEEQMKNKNTKKKQSQEQNKKKGQEKPKNKTRNGKGKQVQNKNQKVNKTKVTKIEVKQPQHKVKKNNKVRSWILVIITIVCLSVLITSSLKLYHWLNDNKEIKKINKEIEKEVPIIKKEEPGEPINPPEDKKSDYWEYMKLPFLEVDFTELLKKNSDTVGFIHMDNTNINYPIVKTDNNEYYLTHAFDKSYNSAGWVFMDYRNNMSELSANTIIYGHGRLDTTVFGSLKKTLTKSWQSNKNNYIIYLSTREKNMLFQIFSIYTVPAESYYIKTDFASNYEKKEWLNEMKKRNVAPIDTPVDVFDNIITLSTCENNGGGRIVVQAKLIKQQAR